MRNILKRYAMVIALYCSYQAVQAQEITSFTLINAEEDIEIGILSDGDSIHIPDLASDQLNIRADVSGTIGSILFRLDGAIVSAQNRAPYALFGSSENDYNPWTPEPKTYAITGSVYSLPQGQGVLLNTYTISLSFSNPILEEPLGPTVHSLVLINADTDEDIGEITEGSIFILEEIGTSNLNIRAETSAETESVVFDYQGELNYHTENLIEYAIGANDDDDYRPWIPDLGANTLTVTAFTADRGEGISGNPVTVNFEIIEEVPEEIPPYVLRINSGGETVVFNDSIFVADTLYVGNSKPYTNAAIEDFLETTQDSLYKTERTTNGRLQSFGYNIPVTDGEYEVKLHFAEIYWGATGGGPGGEGRRVFHVSIEGEEVLTEYDMNAEKDPMTAIVKTFSATVLDGELNIDFGASVDQPKIAALEIYALNPILPTIDCAWTELASSASSATAAKSVMVNDKLYVISSMQSDSTHTSLTEIYDPSTNEWSIAAPIPTAVTDMSAVGVADEIWVIAGIEGDSVKVATDRVQIYNTGTDTWSEGPALPSPRSLGAAAFSAGKIHFFGGLMEDKVTDAAEHYIFDLADTLGVWQTAAPLPNPRNSLSAANVDGKIYAIGGQHESDDDIEYLSLVEEYDLITDRWIPKADLPKGRSNFESGTTVYGNTILLVGGVGDEYLFDEVTEYDIAADTWSERCKMPYQFIAPSAKVFESQLIVTGSDDNGENKTISIPLKTEIEIPEEEELNVLVYHETAGFRHSSIPAGIAMITEFGNDLDWKVTESETSAIFERDSLATYDVVIWLNTTGEDLLTDAEQSAFEEFIQNGGGFIGVHSATDTYRNGSWPWYNDLVGAIVQVNPYHTANNTNATIDVVGEHPAVAHLEIEWNKNEEYYYWERNGGYLYEGNIDLLKVQSTGPNSYDAARPVTWYKEYDGGRSFYTALGHNASDYETNDNFRTMLLEAIRWAAEEAEPLVEEEEEEEEEEEDAPIDPTDNNSIILFPNPVLDQLSISTETFSEEFSGEVVIYGMDGTLMKQKTIHQDDHQIDMSDLSADYYIVSVHVASTSERHLVYKN